MNIHIIAVGKRMPTWVVEGCQSYSKRFAKPYQLTLSEVPSTTVSKTTTSQIAKEKEGEALLAKVATHSRLITLDVLGQSLATPELANKLASFKDASQDITLLIGGPWGLSDKCLAAADESWSLSALTLPHPLVRIILLESLYRAVSVNSGHPYHRE